MNVLSVSYSLAPVALDAVGGAEVVLAHIDEALVDAGHTSVVVAPTGSTVRGALVPTPPVPDVLDDDARARAIAAHRRTVDYALGAFAIDVVCCHGVDFDQTMPDADVPVVVALHLPIAFYPPGAIERAAARPNVQLVCVSRSQARELPEELRARVHVVENGVDLARFSMRASKHRYALALARVCPEKNLPAAITAARRAGMPLFIGGTVFPYEAHQQHFRSAIEPALGRDVKWLGPVQGARKRRLLAGASCVLIPSLVGETSSLVAMEALASGTPVIAYPNGALADLVEDGRTGYLVTDPTSMADAIGRVDRIDPRTCRAAAEARFDLAETTAQWIDRLEASAASRDAERAA